MLTHITKYAGRIHCARQFTTRALTPKLINVSIYGPYSLFTRKFSTQQPSSSYNNNNNIIDTTAIPHTLSSNSTDNNLTSNNAINTDTISNPGDATNTIEVNVPEELDIADQYLAAMDFKAAIEKYTEVIDNKLLPPQIPIEEIYSRRAQAYHRLLKFAEAKADCQAIIEIGDKDFFVAEAYKRMGDITIDEGEHTPFADDAIRIEAAAKSLPFYAESLEKALNEETFQSLGNAFLTLKEFKAAEKAFTDAIRIDAEFAPAFQGKGEAQIGLESWQNAKESYENFLRFQEDYFATFSPVEIDTVHMKTVLGYAHFKLATINLEMAEPEEAKRHCDEILKMDHMYIPQTYGLLAKTLYFEEKFWESIDYCNKALQMDQSLMSVYRIRSLAYEEVGLASEAAADNSTYQFMAAKKQSETFYLNSKIHVKLQENAEQQQAKKVKKK